MYNPDGGSSTLPLHLSGHVGYLASGQLNASIEPRFSFLPPASAFDVPVTAATLNSTFASNLGTPAQPALARFLAQERAATGTTTAYNQPHLTFTARNGEWLFNEMQRPFTNGAPNTVGCTTECPAPADLAFAGPSTVCGPTTYSTPPRGPGYTYTWTASPASLFTVAGGTGTTFTTSNATLDGQGIITLQITGDCLRTLTTEVSVGAPSSPTITGPIRLCDTDTYTISNYDPSLTYRFSTTGPVIVKNRAGSTFVLQARNPGTGSVTVTAQNSCNSTVGEPMTVEVVDCSPQGGYTVYPNPSNDQTTVAATSGGSFDATLYDGQGQLRYQQAAAPGKLRLDTRLLPAGLYHLQLRRGSAVVRRQLQVTH